MNNIQKFNQLHATNEILFLGNAWDLLSALALEKAGFQAIGTTSWVLQTVWELRTVSKLNFSPI
jgi:2-methylisocitrate lyase-like PEP mutase family enzyme